MARVRLPALASLMLAACTTFAHAGGADDKAAAKSADARVSTSGSDIACTIDADCPNLACGPCTPGTHIDKEDPALRMSCTVNPCVNGGAVCSAEHVCVVNPKARQNPAVWRKPEQQQHH